ncbi:MAG: penicillin-binding protein 2 [Thermoleophilia bacterium]|nr:penicillin-binding protein 2 [Thermoleophilia bacterium]
MPVLADPNRRIRFTLFLFLLVFIAVIGKTVYLQTVKAEEFSAKASEQQVKEFTFPARRGTIFDRNGHELAVGEEAKSITADPFYIENPLETAEFLAPLLKVDQKELLEKLSSREKSSSVYLARKIDPATAAIIEDAHISGLWMHSEEKRRYPQKQVAAQVLGFAGTDNQGLAGMELQLDEYLTGTGGSQRIVFDPAGNQIETLSLEEGSRGTDVTLTIDQALQFEAEKVLSETVSQWSAKSAACIIMNPKNGEILAMANVPTVDANTFSQISEDQRRNRTVVDTYEPGSIFKAVTVGAGLEVGAVAPGQTYYLPTTLELGGRTIKDAVDRGEVDWDLGQILVHSSNIGAVTVGMRTGEAQLDEWIRRFGFGSPTGIDFPGEEIGIVWPPEDWSESTIGNVPIGQGLSVTAVQMAAAYSTIANNGIAVTPRLVRAIGDEPVASAEGRRIISEQNSRQLRSYLQMVVEEGGAPLAQIDGYHVAGKTGTAQKLLPDHSAYSDEDYIGSFIGMVPASDPQLVVLVMVDEPHPFGGGGTVAAPAFQKITQFSLQKMEIAP